MGQPLGHRLDWILNLYNDNTADEQCFLEWPADIAEKAKAEMNEDLGVGIRRILKRH